jgi:predicted membrane protein
MMVGKKQLKHLSTLGYSRVLAKSTNMITVNCTIAIIRGDQEGLFKLVTLDPILNGITGVTSGCWWLVVVNAIPISDICKINQQNISNCSVINNRIKKIS